MISTELRKDYASNTNMLLIKCVLDEMFYQGLGLDSSGKYQKIIEDVTKRIADHLYPEIEKQVLSDPTFKDRMINDIFIRIADKLSHKRLIKKKK